MTSRKDAAPESVRITLRMGSEQRVLLRRAAEATGQSLPAFVLNSALKAAEQLLGVAVHEQGDKVPNATTRAAMNEARMILTARKNSHVDAQLLSEKGVESLPSFTRLARQRWESIPADIRQRLLSNVWCGQCRHEITITNFSGTIKGGDLLLVGKCAECHGDVARVIDGA